MALPKDDGNKLVSKGSHLVKKLPTNVVTTDTGVMDLIKS